VTDHTKWHGRWSWDGTGWLIEGVDQRMRKVLDGSVVEIGPRGFGHIAGRSLCIQTSCIKDLTKDLEMCVLNVVSLLLVLELTLLFLKLPK